MRYDVPRGPPNILVKFRSKIPPPLPFTGGAPCLELKQGLSGPTTKKILGAPGPLTGEIWGSKFQLPPVPPQIPFFRYRNSSGYWPGSAPTTIPEILVNLRATETKILSISLCPTAPGIYRGQKPIKRSLLFCWILLHIGYFQI